MAYNQEMRPALLLLLEVCSQDLHELRIVDIKGDSYTLKSIKDFKAHSTYTEGDNRTVLESSACETLIYNDLILEVNGAQATRIRRRIDTWQDKSTSPNTNITEHFALEGRTFDIVLKDGTTSYEGVARNPRVELELERHRIKHGRLHALLPKFAVAVGTSWDINEALFLQDMADIPGSKPGSAKGKAKFERIEDVQGVRCAVVSAALRVEATQLGDVPTRFDEDVRMQMWLGLTDGRLYRTKTNLNGTHIGEGSQKGKTCTNKGTHKQDSTVELSYR